jgi:tetratricopeptide (TPR) repeat protein
VRANLALALKLQGRAREAIPHALDAVRLQPENSIAWNTLCAAQYELGDQTAARRAGRIAVALNPTMAEAWNNLANTMVELGDYAARAAFLAALAREPRLAEAWSGLGTVGMRYSRPDEALDAFARSLALRRASRWWPQGSWPIPPDLTQTNTLKLRHDIEQITHLRRIGVLDASFDAVIENYRAAFAKFVARYGATTNGHLDAEDVASIGAVYGRIVSWSPPPAIPSGAVSSTWDRQIVTRQFADPPGICWVDNLLTPEALAALRRFCLDATIWNDISHNFQSAKVARGYLGAYVSDGFLAPLLFQIADELSRALPGIFSGHPLRQLWAYKYDEALEGIGIHGDDAAVNVNFWLTPDDANLDPQSGGLTVYPVEAPPEWDFGALNTEPDRIWDFLKASGVPPVVVPYRQNRAVIFNSDLFHATSSLRFKSGYENRRINVTMLFGKRR